MILEYRGFNNNWCFIEAQTIISSNVFVGDVVSKAKKTSYTDDGQALANAKEMMEAVNAFIQKETGCGDEIIYLLGDIPFDEMRNICVVTLNDKNLNTTYVFDGGVYLLNNSGKTVQKLA